MSKSIQIQIAEHAKTMTTNPVVIDVIERAVDQVKEGQQLMCIMEDLAPECDDWMSDDNADRDEVFELAHNLRKITDNGTKAP